MNKVTKYVGIIALLANVVLAVAAFTFIDEINDLVSLVMLSSSFVSGGFIIERLVAAQNDDEWVEANKVEAGVDDEAD